MQQAFSATLKSKELQEAVFDFRQTKRQRARAGEAPGRPGGSDRREDPTRIVRRWLHSMDQRAR